MNTNRFKMAALAAALLATAGLSVGLTGCDAAGPADDALATTAPAALDGETLFRGLLMGEGEAAAILPEVHGSPAARERQGKLSLEQIAQRAAVNHYVVNTIRAEAPGFFDDFAAGVTSGRPDRADAALQQGAEHIVAALSAHPDADVRAALGAAKSAASSVADTEESCLLVVAVAVVAAVAIWVWKYMPKEVTVENKSGDTQLHREQVAAWVAERLDARSALALR